jgi:hypothetical protein
MSDEWLLCSRIVQPGKKGSDYCLLGLLKTVNRLQALKCIASSFGCKTATTWTSIGSLKRSQQRGIEPFLCAILPARPWGREDGVESGQFLPPEG